MTRQNKKDWIEKYTKPKFKFLSIVVIFSNVAEL